jgi:hypothetical protein
MFHINDNIYTPRVFRYYRFPRGFPSKITYAFLISLNPPCHVELYFSNNTDLYNSLRSPVCNILNSLLFLFTTK